MGIIIGHGLGGNGGGMNGIAKLQRVPLREVWRHEAHDFTRWLEENIDVLSDAIDVNLVNVEREKKTESTFSVDLMAEDEAGNIFIIENQLERSNHDHLGKVITYLTAMQAKALLWCLRANRDETPVTEEQTASARQG